MFPDIKEIRKRKKEHLDAGEDLAFKEYHDATSFKRLKKYIQGG